MGGSRRKNFECRRQEAFCLIQAIFDKCDRVIAVKGSAFAQKTFAFCRKTDVEPRPGH